MRYHVVSHVDRLSTSDLGDISELVHYSESLRRTTNHFTRRHYYFINLNRVRGDLAPPLHNILTDVEKDRRVRRTPCLDENPLAGFFGNTTWFATPMNWERFP